MSISSSCDRTAGHAPDERIDPQETIAARENSHLLICPACRSREVIRLSADQAQCGPCGEIFFIANLEEAA